MKLQNPPKAMIALVALICTTVLIGVNSITPEAGMPVVTLIVGYAVGNGIAARSGDPVEPIIGRKEPKK